MLPQVRPALQGDLHRIDASLRHIQRDLRRHILGAALDQATRVRVIEGFSSEIGSVRMFGLTMHDVARSLVAATSSSRFTDPNYWRDPNSGNAFQIQVEIPQHKMASTEDVQNLPVMNHDGVAGTDVFVYKTAD